MKNISHRIYAFLIVLLCFSLSSIVFFTQDNEIHRHIGKEVPNIEIEDFTLYLSNLQYTQAISLGKKALRFEEHEEIYELFIHQVNNGLNEYMYAPFVYSKNRIYTFSQGVDYLRLDGLGFWSEWGNYNYDTHLFLGKNDFVLYNSTTKTMGKNIYYDMLRGKLKAEFVKANMLIGSK